MESETLLFIIAYILIAACLVAPPTEFVSAGLTVQNIFSNILGSEDIQFVEYHIKRTALTLIFHSLIPLGNWCLLVGLLIYILAHL